MAEGKRLVCSKHYLSAENFLYIGYQAALLGRSGGSRKGVKQYVCAGTRTNWEALRLSQGPTCEIAVAEAATGEKNISLYYLDYFQPGVAVSMGIVESAAEVQSTGLARTKHPFIPSRTPCHFSAG